MKKIEQDLTQHALKDLYFILKESQLLHFCSLSTKEKEILTLRLEEEKSYTVIGECYELSHERIKQIYKRSIYKLKKNIQLVLNDYQILTSAHGENKRLRMGNASLKLQLEKIQKQRRKTHSI